MQLAFFHLLFLAAYFPLETSAVHCSNPIRRTIQDKRSLQRRAQPPCVRCPTGNKGWRSKFHPATISIEPSEDVVSDDWYPSGCGEHGWFCIEVDKGIEYSSGGFPGYPQGRWKKANGKQVFLGLYWQSTIQFVGPGVTFNIYPAHCTTYIIAKGESSLVIVDGARKLTGGGQKCCGNAHDVDVGLIQFLYRKDAQGQEQGQGQQ
ncbi:hypothetical protein AC578_8992 [Pseudocercospora eumusae]|uniref:Uncharacterized protein n=1 Tax=Pseudocercospora eumusae TaxID=321146 RepID=A0A139HAA3_9PEZI|nr:hypothetical protein AC578_8992 [Pseudocercospora eumusae]KXS99372.1 hypothetical protein AC578_8992 [Pseudocercospora eumusae]KXS99373.1 hypothetical protein AC578_8992 [Pseudocercospora eumusae]